MVTILEEIEGGHLLMIFLGAVAAGFVAVYVDAYLVSKVESAVGITPTAY